MNARPQPRLDDTRVTDRVVPTARRYVGVCGVRWCAVLLCGLPVLPLGSALAEVVTARFQVAAQVLPHVRLQATDTDSSLRLTSADIARGYVDVRRHYLLHTNAPDRVAVQIHPRVGLAAAVDVAGFAGPLRLLDTGLEVTAPAESELDLSFRLWLNDGVSPGAYALPLHLAAIVR